MTTDTSTRIDRAKATLLLGALGDSLGAAVEFMKHDEMLERYDADALIPGVQTPQAAYGVQSPVTDDTQMTLFLANSLVTAHKRGSERGIMAEYSFYSALSYLEWLGTQGEPDVKQGTPDWTNPELLKIIEAQGRRAPGITCLTALKSHTSTDHIAHNDSKGCGTVMRIAPAGLYFGNLSKETNTAQLQKIYDQGVKDAAITHGHPTAHHASGVLAVMIALCLHGATIKESVERVLADFTDAEVSPLLQKALLFSEEAPSLSKVSELGEGWIAEEALAMGLYAALLYENGALSSADALRIAVNHDGDSDSTGAIAGNFIGVRFGMQAVPEELIVEDSEFAELRPTIEKLAEELIQVAEYIPSYARG